MLLFQTLFNFIDIGYLGSLNLGVNVRQGIGGDLISRILFCEFVINVNKFLLSL